MILVTAATGHIGKELIPQLQATGQAVRVLARDEKKVAQALRARRINPRLWSGLDVSSPRHVHE